MRGSIRVSLNRCWIGGSITWFSMIRNGNHAALYSTSIVRRQRGLQSPNAQLMMMMMMGVGRCNYLTPPLQVVCVRPQAHPSPVAVIVCRIPGFQKHIADDGQVRRQAVAYRDNARNTSRGARTHTTEIKIVRVYCEAVPVKRELDSFDGVARHAPEPWTVLACAFGTRNERVECGRERCRHVNEGRACVNRCGQFSWCPSRWPTGRPC